MWKHSTLKPSGFFSVNLVLLGSTCLQQTENHHLPNTFAFSLTDKVKTFTGLLLWLMWFLLTCSFSGFFFSITRSVFSLSFTIPATQRAFTYSTCVCLHDHVKPQTIDVSLSFLLGQQCSSDVQLSVSTSKKDETKTAEPKQHRSLDVSLPAGSPIQRARPECSAVLYLCQRESGSISCKFKHGVWSQKHAHTLSKVQRSGVV